MSNRKTKIKRGNTEDGTSLGFRDDFGWECTLRNSFMDSGLVFLGVSDKRLLGSDGLTRHVRAETVWMLLNRKQARQIAEELLYFADNGKLREADE